MSLPLLGSATKQDHQCFAITSKIDSVAGTGIDTVFENAGADRFHIRHIALFKTRKRDRDFRTGLRIEFGEPAPKGAFSEYVDLSQHLHSYSIIYVTNYGKCKAAHLTLWNSYLATASIKNSSAFAANARMFTCRSALPVSSVMARSIDGPTIAMQEWPAASP